MSSTDEPNIESGTTFAEDTAEVEGANIELIQVRKILGRLRKWYNWETRRQQSLRWYITSFFFPRRPPCPSEDELKRLALFFFPSRASDTKVEICDFGENRYEHSETSIDEVKLFFRSKPDWAKIRWIHAPVGLGLVHNSIRLDFHELGPGVETKPVWYENAGPDLSCEVVSLRDKQYLQDQLDVFNILRDFDGLTAELENRETPHTSRLDLNNNIDSTARSLDLDQTFWHLCLTDIPWQLGEGTRSSLLDLDLGVNPASRTIDEQLLSRHPRYENAVLVRALFQCYHRDGFILTMSPIAGINYLDKTFLQNISRRPGMRAAFDKASFIGHYMQNHDALGSTNWPSEEPVWFAIKLLTDILITPKQLPSGTPVPPIQRAYLPLVRDLKTRRGAQFKRYETVNLVREYVSCMDEISQIYSISERKLDFLATLRKDCAGMREDTETTDLSAANPDNNLRLPPTADNRTRELIVDMVDHAISCIKADHEEFPKMLNDLRNSLDDLFQLRTIEQNELAILAESNNKAILVFTVVTIVFLPLSFFTSYFGMNSGNTILLSSEGYFWGVCGTVTLVIVLFTIVYGFKDRLYGWLWGNRRFSLGSEYYYRQKKHN